MGMRLFWRFASDQGDVTVTSTDGAGFAGANLQRDALSKKWKSAAVLATETITYDLGSPLPVSAFALWGHNLLVGDTLTLTYASDSGFTADTGTVAITWREWYLLELFTEVTRQHWKLDILKAAAATSKEAGRFLLGQHYELSSSLRTPGDSFGIAKSAANRNVRTEGGTKYGDVGVGLNRLPGTITGLSNADRVEIETLKETYTTAMSFVAAADWDHNKLRVQYGSLDGLVPCRPVSPEEWSWAFAQTEQR